MPLLVTSASGANGDGFGALLTFELDATLRGTFLDDDRIIAIRVALPSIQTKTCCF
jgi:hypothetical protein